ncbi:serine/threonine-kinase pknD domain protein, partial [Chlamydia psittaci 06-1683]
YLLVRFIC